MIIGRVAHACDPYLLVRVAGTENPHAALTKYDVADPGAGMSECRGIDFTVVDEP